jgi:magnesium and cobalt transporter
VYETNIDEITGVVRLRDLAAAIADGITGNVAALQKPPLFIPETRRVVDVLRDMQDQGNTIAVVVDEHGGTAGIVTVEDIVEELVGAIADSEGAISEIRGIGPGRWVVRGSADIDDLEREMGTKLPRGDYHTVAGLILAMTGRIPHAGEEFTVGDHHFRVAEASRRRIRLVEVRHK